MTEAQEQKEVVAWFRERWPQHQQALRLSLNGLNFGSGRKAAKMINYIKSQGAVKGEADLAILLPRKGYGCLVIEHKAKYDTRRPDQDQLDYIGYHNHIGNLAVVTKGVEDMKSVILDYMTF